MALVSEGDSSSCKARRISGSRGTSGMDGTGGTCWLFASSYPWNPVCVRDMGLGLKFSSSSSCIVGSTLETLRARTGDMLSESCEYAESSLGRRALGLGSTWTTSKPVGARERGFGRSPRPMGPMRWGWGGGGCAWLLMWPISIFLPSGGDISPCEVRVRVRLLRCSV